MRNNQNLFYQFLLCFHSVKMKILIADILIIIDKYDITHTTAQHLICQHKIKSNEGKKQFHIKWQQ